MSITVEYRSADIHFIILVTYLLKKNKYRKYKEVYQADVDMIKYFIQGCSTMKLRYKSRKSKREIKGGYYIAVFNEEQLL